MKITKELQNKINRLFEAKEAEIRRAYIDASAIDKKAYEAQIKNDLETIGATAPALMDLLIKTTKRNLYGVSDPPTSTEIVTYLCNRIDTPEREELGEKRVADSLANSRAREDFLIQISYAENLTSLKDIFEKFNMPW